MHLDFGQQLQRLHAAVIGPVAAVVAAWLTGQQFDPHLSAMALAGAEAKIDFGLRENQIVLHLYVVRDGKKNRRPLRVSWGRFG